MGYGAKAKGGATVLKVEDNFASEASEKMFFDPNLLHTRGSWNRTLHSF